MTVGSGNYSYKAVSDNSVTLQIKKAETKHGVLSIPIKQELVNSEIIKQQKNGKESILCIDTIKMTLRIIDLDDTKEFISPQFFSENYKKFLSSISIYNKIKEYVK